jgi:hypothetical protein
MTDREEYWLGVCKRRTEEYVIEVDNDSVFVTDIKSGDCVFLFNNYGWQFVIDLLRYIGCNAQEV